MRVDAAPLTKGHNKVNFNRNKNKYKSREHVHYKLNEAFH